DVQITKADQAGRVGELKTAWRLSGKNSVTTLSVSGVLFRDWIGSSVIRSTLFGIKAAGNSWRFEGRGYGHGVGMCQWGAKKMGESGYSASAILKHYYPDAILRKMW
ncbi:MAG: cell division protein, partial [Bdellovibrionota bacterium]